MSLILKHACSICEDKIYLRVLMAKANSIVKEASLLDYHDVMCNLIISLILFLIYSLTDSNKGEYKGQFSRTL